jgi:hypothetical protein
VAENDLPVAVDHGHAKVRPAEVGSKYEFFH